MSFLKLNKIYIDNEDEFIELEYESPDRALSIANLENRIMFKSEALLLSSTSVSGISDS